MQNDTGLKIRIAEELSVIGNCPEFLQRVASELTFQNPRHIENERQGRWNGDTPRELSFARQTFDHITCESGLTCPRGFAGRLIRMARAAGIAYEVDDKRRTLPDVSFDFSGTLKPFQDEAVEAMLRKDFGTLDAPTASGKTVMALAMVAARNQPALIIVHTRELMQQWVDRIGAFLGIPASEVGVIGNGEKRIGDRISVGIVNSVYPMAETLKEQIGFLVVDECHRCPSRTFMEAVSAFDCRYMLGLSATPYRRDKLTCLIHWYLGDCHCKIDRKDLVKSGDVCPIEVIRRETAFSPTADPSAEYSKMLSELTTDSARNSLIAGDIIREANNGGGSCLVLSDRKEHCEALQALISRSGVSTAVLTGDVPDRERQAIVERLNKGDIPVLVATGQLIGEGFDCRNLSTLFLATPIKFTGRLSQYLGRVLRAAPGKEKAIVYDYIDRNVGVLVTAAKERTRVYPTLQPRYKPVTSL